MAKNKHIIEVEGKGFGKVKGQAKGLGGAMGGLAKNVALVAGAYFAGKGLINAFQFATRVGKEFEQSMANLKAISGATSSEMLKLSANARQLGASTKFTASQVGELSVNYAKLGFSASQILKVSEATLNLASATGEDLATSSAVAGGTLRGFGLEAEKTGMLTDVMAKSFATSALDLAKFSGAMTYVAPVAKVAGFSLQETTAILGQLANSSIDGSMAGTSLKNALTQMTVPGSKLSKVFGTTVNNFEEFVAVLKQTKEQGGLTKTQLGMIPKLLQATIPVLIESSDKMMAYKESLDDAGGSAERMAEIQMATLEGKMLTLNSATEGLGIAFFDTFDETLKSAVDGVTEMVSAMDSWLSIPMAEKLDEQRISLNAMVGRLGDANISEKTRKQIMQEIVDIYPSFFEGLDKETTDYKTLETRLKGVNDELLNKVILQQNLDDQADLVDQQSDAWNDMFDAEEKVAIAIQKIAEEFGTTTDKSKPLNEQLEELKHNLAFEVTPEMGEVKTYLTDLLGLETPDYGKGLTMETALFELQHFVPLMNELRRETNEYNAITGILQISEERLTKIRERLGLVTEDLNDANGGAGGGSGDEIATLMEVASVEALIHQQKLDQIDEQVAKYTDMNVNFNELDKWYTEQVKALNVEKLESYSEYYAFAEAGYNTFVDTILDMEMTGKERREAIWDSMKKSFVKMVGDMLLDWIKTQIAQALFAKTAHATEVATAQATGTAVALAWAPASASVSLATLGTNAVPAGTGITAVHALSMGLSAVEEGGLLSGRSHSQGGMLLEAEGGEFVMRKSAVNRIGVDNLSAMNEGGGGGGITLNITAPLIDDTIIDVIVPAIERAKREGLA